MVRQSNAVIGGERVEVPGHRKAYFGKMHELLYELRIGQIMTTSLITVTPNDSMYTVKELLRSHRISGAPVVEGDRLVGIVSVEDVIKALEAGRVEATVGSCMTAEVVTVQSSNMVVEAVKKFARHKYGRLPVLDAEGRLVGILTPSDITGRLLAMLDQQYHRREEDERQPAPQWLAELQAPGSSMSLRYPVAARDFARGGEAASRIKRALTALGLPLTLVRRAAIIAYEQEMNLIIHTDGGSITVEVEAERVRLAAEDIGPGIPDIEQALKPGFSTAPDWVREMGFGAGMGLNNIKNSADSFHIHSQAGSGTLVEAVISRRQQAEDHGVRREGNGSSSG